MICLETDEDSTFMEVRVVVKALCTPMLTGRLVKDLGGKLYQ